MKRNVKWLTRARRLRGKRLRTKKTKIQIRKRTQTITGIEPSTN